MSRSEPNGPSLKDFAPLGFVGNPFRPLVPKREGQAGLALAVHAAVMRLIRALDAAADEERSRPILAERPEDLAQFFQVLAVQETLRGLTEDASFSVLPVYVQLQTMRGGRVRAGLSGLAEKIAGTRFDLTLAAWTRQVLLEPDESLPEWEPLAEKDLAPLLAGLDEDPMATAADLFGPLMPEREGAREDLEIILRVSGARQDRLEQDPEATDESDEDDTEDPGREIFTAPLGESTEAKLSDETPVSEGGPAHADVVEYIVAHTRAHLSPVVARGIAAYVAQGTSSVSQELKVSKAPRKTIGALARFASVRFRKVALIWDRFDGWEMVESDMRHKIVTALTDVRWALAEHGVTVLLLTAGEVPEVEEQFAAAERVSWEMPRIEELEHGQLGYDEEIVKAWLESALLPGASMPEGAERALATLASEAGGSLEAFAAAAAAAFDAAAARGDGVVGDDDVAVGLAAAALTGGE